MNSQPRFVGYYWGSLFKKFYGEPEWKNYFSRAAATYQTSNLTDIVFSNGTRYTKSDLLNARSGTPPNEIALLMHSDTLYKWSEILNRGLTRLMSNLVDDSLYNNNMLISVDVKSVGCKYSIEDVKKFLTGRSTDEVEHCWSLSNSCGELINPDDTSRFIQLVFRTKGEVSSEPLDTTGKVGDYLTYCLNLYDASKRKSSSGQTQLYESYVKYVREYLSNTDLYYRTPMDNILLTGILYDVCSEYHIYPGSYKKNLESFRFLKQCVLPLVDDLFEYQWVSPATDERLIFPLDAFDILRVVPSLSIIDSNVVLSNKLSYLESYLDKISIESLESKIEAILIKDNPGVELGELWATFHCYYGVYRTAMTRVEKRPDSYKLPITESCRFINFSGVESFFDKLQREIPDCSVRRRFCGSKASDAFACFKRLGIGFAPICRLNIPQQYAYLNIDYYKHAKRANLTDEEVLILSNIAKDVDAMCSDRLSSTKNKPIAQRRGFIINVNKAKEIRRNNLTTELWKNAPRPRARRL